MWQRSASLVAILLGVWPLVWVLAFRAGDYVRLGIMWPSCVAQIAEKHGGPTPFNWGLGGAFLVGVQRTLLYDPDDRPLATGAKFGIGVNSTAHHLVGHFYVIDDDTG